MDADGYFYIVGRLKDIIVGLQHRAARKWRKSCSSIRKCKEAVVAGVPDALPGDGQGVHSAQARRDGYRGIAFCRRLAPYKVPRQVEFRSELQRPWWASSCAGCSSKRSRTSSGWSRA